MTSPLACPSCGHIRQMLLSICLGIYKTFRSERAANLRVP